jgi:hypothetical protein
LVRLDLVGQRHFGVSRRLDKHDLWGEWGRLENTHSLALRASLVRASLASQSGTVQLVFLWQEMLAVAPPGQSISRSQIRASEWNAVFTKSLLKHVFEIKRPFDTFV